MFCHMVEGPNGLIRWRRMLTANSEASVSNKYPSLSTHCLQKGQLGITLEEVAAEQTYHLDPVKA